MIEVLPCRDSDFPGIDALWRCVFPDDPPRARAAIVVPQKLAFQRDLFLVAQDDSHVLGTLLAGYDGHRGWLYKLAVHPDARGHGIARQLVRAAENRLAALGCAKVNLQVRDTNRDAAAFWKHLGYGEEARISMGRTLA